MLIIETTVLPQVKLNNICKVAHSVPGIEAKINRDGLISSRHLWTLGGLAFFP